MSRRESLLVWLRDTLDHLKECQDELQWTNEPTTTRMLTDNMLRDLDTCKQLCESIQVRSELSRIAVG